MSSPRWGPADLVLGLLIRKMPVGLIPQTISRVFSAVGTNGQMIWDYVLYLFVLSTAGIELLRASEHPSARYLLRLLRLDDLVRMPGGGNSFVESALAGGEMGPHHLEIHGHDVRLVYDEPLPACPLERFMLEPASPRPRVAIEPPPGAPTAP